MGKASSWNIRKKHIGKRSKIGPGSVIQPTVPNYRVSVLPFVLREAGLRSILLPPKPYFKSRYSKEEAPNLQPH